MIPSVRRFGIAIVALSLLALLVARWMRGGDAAPEYVAERVGRGPISAASSNLSSALRRSSSSR